MEARSERNKMCMKLLINSQTNRVVCAETGKDCVDFLIQLLSLPLATVISLIQEEETFGRLSNIFESFKGLDHSYLQPGQSKDALFNRIGATKTPPASSELSPLSIASLAPTRGLVYKRDQIFFPLSGVYKSCSSRYYSDTPNAICKTCNRKMTCPFAPLGSKEEEKECGDAGFVRGAAYMVMDDLVIQPLSTSACLNLLGKSGISDIISGRNEIEVQMGFKEAVELLKTCFHSKTVLTDVFLKKNAAQVKTK